MDIEKLISLVHERNALWDQRSSKYHSRDVQRDQWKQVASEMNVPGESI